MKKSSRLRVYYDHQQPVFDTNPSLFYTPMLPSHSTPIQWMAKPAYETILDLLLVHKDTLETIDLHGRTTLCWATEWGFEAGVELLLKKGAILRPPRRSPLLCALANDHASIVRMVLERDIDHSFHTISDEGVTPLNLAASRGNEEAV
ncbi:hypothetical protein EMCG_08875 [[Emmonsia] crescens]|uniref:Uncharacterized protein n=1 Tax=[Emmonsia] crescens TaxID=73230 RepID=A0A0G2I4A4_9EURO|nr:hypothetical protein EMCG_08875 [Emmonsia crescens UAMH 3008]